MTKIEEKLINNLNEILKELYNIQDEENLVMLELPKSKENGQFTTNVAMRLSKRLGKSPKDIGSEIKEKIIKKITDIEKVEIAGPGFINFFIKDDNFFEIINEIIKLNSNYGKNQSGSKEKYLIEYVSANPTGALHLGHARGAVWGDCCYRLMKASGYECIREYYINDAGNQINNLAISIDVRYKELFGKKVEMPEGCYHADDIIEIAQYIKNKDGDKWLNADEKEKIEYMKKIGIQIELDRIKKDLSYYRCEFDSWISEQKFYDEGLIDDVLKKMNNMDLTYEKDGALWFKSSKFGDDKDRVLKKTTGEYTYFTPDIANHVYKLNRGYKKLVDLWGGDHSGYVSRMTYALTALGYPKGTLEVDIIQMVRLIENGVEVKMSKRSGHSFTLRELCDDVGVDTARYFFINKALDTQLDFDLSLARMKTNENPVFYIQYAYVRLNAILRKAGNFDIPKTFENINTDEEIMILRHISQFPTVVAECAKKRAPNKMCNYIYTLAKLVNSYYVSHNVLNSDENIKNERLALIKSIQITMENAFDLIGIEAIKEM